MKQRSLEVILQENSISEFPLHNFMFMCYLQLKFILLHDHFLMQEENIKNVHKLFSLDI